MGAPELENLLMLLARLAIQALPEPSMAIAIGKFNPPPVNPVDWGTPSLESLVMRFGSLPELPFEIQALPELSMAIPKAASSPPPVKPVGGLIATPALENLLAELFEMLAIQALPALSMAIPKG